MKLLLFFGRCIGQESVAIAADSEQFVVLFWHGYFLTAAFRTERVATVSTAHLIK